MIPTRPITSQLATLLAADPATIGAVTANKVGLVTQLFSPSVDLVLADLVIANGTGLVPIAGVAGAQNESVDPVTGELLCEIKEPAGGFRWETPPGFSVPVTVHGFALMDNAAAVLLGTELLPEPITLTDPNQSLNAPPITFRIDPNKVF